MRTIAVVGLSPRPNRPSHRVASALQRFGYRIIPVRPAVDEVLGARVREPARVADEAGPGGRVPRARIHRPIVDDCIALGLQALWLQEGVVDEEAAKRARAAGMQVVMDRCVYRDYVSFFDGAPLSSLGA